MDQPRLSDDSDREAQIAQLAADARALTVGVSQLMGETGTAIVGIAQRNRTNHRAIMAMAISLLLDVALTVAFGFTMESSRHNTARIDRLSSNLRVQLCGELGLLVNADTPASNAAARARGDDMAVRAASFVIIHRSYESLACRALAH
jgi:hypothetical protein